VDRHLGLDHHAGLVSPPPPAPDAGRSTPSSPGEASRSGPGADTRSGIGADTRSGIGADTRSGIGAAPGMGNLGAVLLLAVVAVAVYWSALDNGYHLDDFYRVVDNPGIERVAPVWRHFSDPGTSATLPRLVQYRPMLPLTLSLDVALTGGGPVGHHVGNLLVHVLGAVLLYVLVRRGIRRAASLTSDSLSPAATAGSGARATALAVALLYVVHPVSGVAVNYICARDLLLMQLFLLAALVAFTSGSGRGPGPLGWLAALLAMGLSLLSKTNAVALPLVVLAYEACLGPRPAKVWRPVARALPFALVAAAFFAVTSQVLQFSDAGQLALVRDDAGVYLETGRGQLAQHVSHYLRNVLWPFHMRPLPEVVLPRSWFDPWVLAGAVVVLGSLAWAWTRRRRHPLAAFSILAYWLLFSPTSSVLPFRSAAADYRGYPSLPWVLAAGCLAARALLPARARPLAFGLALAWFVGGSLWQNDVWHDEESFWEQSVRHGGQSMAHTNYARQLAERDPELARHHYEQALVLAPDNALTHINLGLLEMDGGRTDEGLAHVQRAVALAPEWADTHLWWARALALAGRWDEAAPEARLAVELAGPGATLVDTAAELVATAARRAYDEGDDVRALAHLATLHEFTPVHGDSRFLEGWIHQRAGRLAPAFASYRLQLEHAPGHVQARFNLAHGLMSSGDPAAAIPQFERVLEEDPGLRDAHAHLATCHQALGDEDAAAREQALYDAGP
jgi:tetratricopeptide (TPR) repeat protein